MKASHFACGTLKTFYEDALVQVVFESTRPCHAEFRVSSIERRVALALALARATCSDLHFSEEFQMQWTFPPGVTYLNHGSFGPTPKCVLEERERWLHEHAANPMDFFVRRLGPLVEAAEQQLANFVQCPVNNLIFVPNATVGMNIVAENVFLAAGDEVLLTDQDYGAVVRIWGQACKKVKARTVLARLPLPLESVPEIVEAIFAQVTQRTKLLVISHITSPTAVILPVKEICQRAKEQGLMVCVDGPHALAMIDLDLNSIPCDFYIASCHKWLCAPFGSGFLYVRSKHKQGLQPNLVSWGRNLLGQPPVWKDEFRWPGTFDPTPYLAVPAAIDALKTWGLTRFREQTHALAAYARKKLLDIDGTSPLTKDDPAWYGSMVTIRLPEMETAGDAILSHPLQNWLWETEQIEIPVVRWRERIHIRVSCHLYNHREQIDHLAEAVKRWLRTELR